MGIRALLETVLDEIEVPVDVVLRRDLSARITARLDPERLHQAVANVIQNALQSLDASSDGSTVDVSV